MDNWKNYHKSAQQGPSGVLKVFFWFLGSIVVFIVIGYLFGWFSQAADVAKKEFGPKAALAKYEWFIDQANRIEKMDQDVILFEKRVISVENQYKGYGKDISKWPPHIQVQYNVERQQAREDLLAVASQRNNIVREYNSQSEKFNWAPFKTDPRKPQESFYENIY
ncbi:MAG TPA: hypothetical protein VFQ59_00230 [Candidatus Paceibacterota bacterium]|nr:hypothetical protein [Candidatus Paceibacterota bacterium]